MAKRRLADEYDAAQERGEIRKHGERRVSSPETVGYEDAGLNAKELHDARQIRDAEAEDPGIVRRTLDALLQDQEWSRWSNREIARRAGVGANKVGALRKSLATVTSERSFSSLEKVGKTTLRHLRLNEDTAFKPQYGASRGVVIGQKESLPPPPFKHRQLTIAVLRNFPRFNLPFWFRQAR